MYKQRSKRYERNRIILTYTLAPLIIVLVVSLFVLSILGYRFNTQNRTVYQGGLVQFNSNPGGATVSLDGSNISGRTATRENIVAGTHTVGIKRDNYQPWQKTVTVESGKILWLTYPLLIPQNLETEKLYNYGQISSTLHNSKQRLLGVQQSKNKPTFVTIRADDQGQRETSTLPEKLYNPKMIKNNQDKFTPTYWSKSGRYVLYERELVDKKTWFLLNLKKPMQSYDISSTANVPISKVLVSDRNEQIAYILSEGTIRTVSLDTKTLSAPIVRDVISMTQSNKGVISYIAKNKQKSDKTNSKFILGYITPGAQSSRTLELSAVIEPKYLELAEFDRSQYLAVATDDKLDIYEFKLHPSDSQQNNEIELVATIPITKPVTEMMFSPVGRFVMIRSAEQTKVYDLELDKVSVINLRTDGSAGTGAKWLDDFHLLSSYDQKMQLQEFDGENPASLVKSVPGTSAVLSDNGRFLYYIDKDKSGFNVSRLRMILK